MNAGCPPLDELSRQIVVALQADGRASWTDIAAACGTSVSAVSRRGQQLVRDGVVRVAVVPDTNHAGPADLFVLRIGCAAGSQGRVCTQLASRADLRFLALVTGTYDIVAELNVPRSDSLAARVIEDIQGIDGVVRCETDLRLHTYKVAHDWARGDAPTDEREPHQCAPSHFDPTDRAVIAAMSEHGRESFRTVAARLDINESTVRRRFEALQQRGCIVVTTLVPSAALGFESEVILDVTVAPARLTEVADQLSRHRAVRYVAAMLSANRLMCELILPTETDLYRFTTETLGSLDGVTGWAASMELLTIRRGFVETPWWRAQLGT
ncbi:MAG TPA: Lrp/AsnC family transcriptional regulator [Actinocatenispora sp.]